jgi:hypothetical protein
VDNARLGVIEDTMRALLAEARSVTDTAGKAKRALTADEKSVIEDRMSKVDELAAERKSLVEAGATADSIRSKAAGRDGFARLAKAIVDAKGAPVAFTADLKDFAGKGVTATDVSDAAKIEVPGIGAQLENLDSIYQVFAQASPGTALSVEEFSVTGREVTGTIERDPLSTSAKATLDVTIAADSEDLKQFALILDGIPNALAGAGGGALDAALREQMRRALYAELDDHVMAKIDAAATYVSTGSDIYSKIRACVSALRSTGANPTHAVISEADAATIDLDAADEVPQAWPFGLTVLVHPDVADSGYVFDASGLQMYLGGLSAQTDPFAGVDGANFSKNMFDLRAEFTALGHVREAGKFTKFDLSPLT